MTTEHAGSRERHGWLTLRRWLVLCALGLGILILAALLRGTPEDIRWYVAHVVPFVAVVVLSTTRVGRAVGLTALISYAVAMPVLTLLAGFGITDFWNDGLRIQLFTDNPNLLGADLVVASVAAMVVLPRHSWASWLPIVALAVMFTGSRTALLALVSAGGAWVMLSRNKMIRVLSLSSAALVAATIAVADWSLRQESLGPNLLPVSTSFAHGSWSVYGSAQVSVSPKASPGPHPGTRAEHIQASTMDHPLTLHRGIGRSVKGEPYVASVYLRADKPQEVVLSTQLSRITCRVTADWTRCVTPVGVGNGSWAVQFRLESASTVGGFDLYAFGPQLERSDSASTYNARRRGSEVPLESRVRLALRDVPHIVDSVRLKTAADYLSLFFASPLVGAGLSAKASMEHGGAVPEVAQPNHAHNLLVGRLAGEGIFGVAGWLAITLPLALAAIHSDRRTLIPLLIALAVLNTFDMTVFHSGTFLSVALTLGRMAASLHRD